MTTRKDELLAKIVQLEGSLVTNRAEYTSKVEAHKPLTEHKRAMQKAADEIQKALVAAMTAYTESERNIRALTQQGIAEREELAQTRRELARLADAESLNEQYVQQVNTFKEACLTAPWRAENRTDGFGAKPHQIDGAIHLAVCERALLGDKRGLGKTLTGLIYADLKEAKRIVVITPPDTMNNFIREIQLWTPHRTIVKIGKMPKAQRDFVLAHMSLQAEFVLVLNYEAWRRDEQLIEDIISLNCDTVIYDEAHRAKETKTSTCKGVRNIRFGLNSCPNPECYNPKPVRGHSQEYHESYNVVTCESCLTEGFVTDFCSIKNVLPMTGTPILNRPQELFPHLNMLDPENFPTEKIFLKDFCRKDNANRWVWQYKGEEELIKKMGPRYLARDRDSAGVQIPKSSPVEHLISMADFQESYPAQFKAYLQARDYAQLLLNPDNDSTMSMPEYITVLLRLRQVLTWPAAIELVVHDDFGNEKFREHLNVYESVKVDKAEEIIREAIEEGERVVLFSQFKGPLTELQRRFDSPVTAKGYPVRSVIYNGDTSSYKRNEIQLDFDPKTVGKKPRWDVVLCNYKAAGEGLNFNAARQMVIMDEEWNPGRQSQAYGRIDRLGQEGETLIHTIRVEKTVDTWMQELIKAKAEIVGGFEEQAGEVQSAYDALRAGEM